MRAREAVELAVALLLLAVGVLVALAIELPWWAW